MADQTVLLVLAASTLIIDKLELIAQLELSLILATTYLCGLGIIGLTSLQNNYFRFAWQFRNSNVDNIFNSDGNGIGAIYCT